jgi:hypothetical protein
VTYHVRIEFTWCGERVHEFVGPFGDRWMAEVYTDYFAHNPFLFGITPVRVERARIVAGGTE